MLTHAHNWFMSDATNAAVALEAAVMGSYKALWNVLFWGTSAPNLLSTSMKMVLRAWSGAAGPRVADPQVRSPNTPLWINPSLPEFYSIPDPVLWASRGIRYLHTICENGALLTFDQLKARFNLPNVYFFQFLQLRHAYRAQFGDSPLTLYQSNMESLLRQETLNKPLSTIYKALQPTVHHGLERLRDFWVSELPEFDGEDWEDIWDSPFGQLVSSRDRLIQFKILHKFYYTPYRLHKIYPARCSVGAVKLTLRVSYT